MKMIILEHGRGKTTELIKLSAKTGYYIVCINIEEVSRVVCLSKEMGMNIPFPLTFQEFSSGQYYAKGIKGFLIDNAELFIQSLSKVPVVAISLSPTPPEGV